MKRITADALVVGGGVVGLSLAWRLSEAGLQVALVDRGEVGKAASWAGAGILPPARVESAIHPIERLRGLANQLHAEWAAELREVTGIDTGYRRCGGVYVARTPGESASLLGLASLFEEEGIESEQWDESACRAHEPQVNPQPPLRMALWTPEECQLRNPWHLRGLRAICERSGVAIYEHQPITQWRQEQGRVVGARSEQIEWSAGSYCITAGAWSSALLESLGLPNGILPIRGQMVLFRSARPLATAIINEGTRYLVPREDGRLLAGSTEEEVGFDSRPSREPIDDLVGFAYSLIPALRAEAEIEAVWAGLRPGSYDGMPYMGRLPDCDNAYVASGHFRSGLSLSPAIATLMTELILGRQPAIDLSQFRVDRQTHPRVPIPSSSSANTLHGH